MTPTAEELQIAIAEAQRMREQGDDEFHLAKALLNLHYRQQHYDALRQAVEHYFRSGQAEREHTLLLKALEQVKQMEEHTAGGDHEDLGLG